MFYILNLDHHGYYKGVYHQFEKKEEAKSYLNTKKCSIRIGCICYDIISNDKKLLSNIIFESLAKDVYFDESSGYNAEDDSVFHKDMNKLLNFVEKYKDIISDDIFEGIYY